MFFAASRRFTRQSFLASLRPTLFKAAVALFASLSLQAAADNYPSRTVTLVSPYPPGGITDLLARMIATGMGEDLGQSVIVANKGGGGGSIGAAAVATSAPDGYTILLGALGPLSINKLLNDSIPYDPRDFEPIVQIGSAPVILGVHPNLPVKSAAEYIEYAKKNPERLNVATSGAGTPGHLSGVLFNDATKLKSTFVHYKGAGPSLTDLVGGQVQATFENAAALLPHIKAGKVKPLAVFAPKRLAMLPDVPTLTELGITGVEANGWYGLVAPAKTPKAITEKLRVAATKALQSAEVRNKLEGLGVVVTPGTAEEFGKFIRDEYARWTPVIKRLDIPKY